MASEVRTRRVWGPIATGASPVVVYTVPAGRTLILRGVGVHSQIGTANALELRADVGSGPLSLRFWPGPGAGVRYWDYDDRWRVFNPGDILSFHAAGSVNWTSTGYGVLLPGPPA